MATKTPVLTALPPDLFWESGLASHFGVSRSHLRKLRHTHLVAADDWRIHENAVVITFAGLAKLRGALTQGSAPALDRPSPATTTGGPAAAPSSAQPGPPESRHFVITRVPQHRVNAPQKRLVLARPVAADFTPCSSWELPKRLAHVVHSPELRERAVRVRDNTNFTPGMVIEAVAIGFGTWQYRGRLPRRPGRW